ncbi:hypothetical protein RFI_25685, partial [Reticulomyxa filosa]
MNYFDHKNNLSFHKQLDNYLFVLLNQKKIEKIELTIAVIVQNWSLMRNWKSYFYKIFSIVLNLDGDVNIYYFVKLFSLQKYMSKYNKLHQLLQTNDNNGVIDGNGCVLKILVMQIQFYLNQGIKVGNKNKLYLMKEDTGICVIKKEIKLNIPPYCLREV